MPTSASVQTKRDTLINSADPIQMDVDLTALKANYRRVQQVVGGDIKIMASVKGNGYGAGVAAVAAALRDEGVYAVATGAIRDALAIREAGNDVPIHMFPGILPDALPILYANNLTPTIYNQQLADRACEVARSKWNVFIKIDAGFGRLGVPLEEAESFVLSLAKKPNLAIEGIFTHLPFVGEAALGWVNDRLQRFDDVVARIRRKGVEIPIRQSLASSGVINGLNTASNTVCVGHLLFGGLGRFGPDDAIASQFEPVHKTIRTRIIDARRYTSDVMVGSGGKLSLKSGAMLGTVPLGLHEGYQAGAAGRQPCMLIDGIKAPVVWVSQEYSVLDLSNHHHVALGDEVIALGSSGDLHITIEDMAAWQGRTPLQVVMAMDRAIPKHYLSAH